MTRKEQAYVQRLEKRLDSLLSAFFVIKTWLAFNDDPGTLCYQIGKLVTQEIFNERRAQEKERDTKGAAQ